MSHKRQAPTTDEERHEMERGYLNMQLKLKCAFCFTDEIKFVKRRTGYAQVLK